MMLSWSVSKGLLVVAASFHVIASVMAEEPLSTSTFSNRHLQDNATQTVTEILANDPELTRLSTALASTKLLDGLTSSFTLLAPTDAAFAALEATVVGTRILTKTGFTAHLEDVLLLHVAATSSVLAADLMTGATLTMANDEIVTVGAGPTFSGPSNNATSPAKVTAADILATNGVIHKIDTVLLPGFWSSDVVTLAETIDIDSLGTLKKLFLQVKDDPTSTAILAAARTLEVTMFAPIDDAFAGLGETTIDKILNDTNGLLINILQNHVVLQVIPYDSLVDGLSVPTLRNGPLTVSVVDVLGEETVQLGGSTVLETILANNGIIHTIENVLLSPDDEALLLPSNETAPVAAPPTTTTSAAPVAAPTVATTDAPVSAPTVATTDAPVASTNATSPIPTVATVPTVSTEKPTSAPAAKVATPPAGSSATTALVGTSSLSLVVSAMAAVTLYLTTTTTNLF